MASKDMRNISKARKHLRFQVSSHERRLTETQDMLQISRDVLRLQEIARSSLRSVEALSRHAYMNSTLEPIQKLQGMQEIARMANNRFYLPEITNAIHLLGQFENTALSNVLARYQMSPSHIHNSFEAVRNSWLDIEHELQSLDGFVALMGIGHALNTMGPFDTHLTDALRIDLGDWRDDIIWPLSLFVDPAVRTSFYEDRGLNPNLTAFPADSFEELVVSSGIREPWAPDVNKSPFDHEQDDADLEVAFQRTNEAHDLLQRFETKLREFLEERMNEKVGTNWIKHRVPGETRKRWLEKQQKAKDNGESGWPLIAYADFSDYIVIIVRNDNWQEVFKDVFVRKTSVQESFQRLIPIRTGTMHSRVITQDDELLLFVEARRILEAIRKSRV